eukprot:PhF_6_TR25328/c0_g1_i1/m.35004
MTDRYVPLFDRESFHTPQQCSSDQYNRALRESYVPPSGVSVFSFNTGGNATPTASRSITSGPDDDDDSFFLSHVASPQGSLTYNTNMGTTGLRCSTPPPRDSIGSMPPPPLMMHSPTPAATSTIWPHSSSPAPPRWDVPTTSDRRTNNGGTPQRTPPVTPERLPTRTPPPSSRHTRRSQINSSPSRALDAPGIRVEDRCSLLDWGAPNVVVVLIGNVVYGWCADTHTILFNVEIGHVCAQSITFLKCLSEGNHIAVGYTDGTVEVRTVQPGASNSFPVTHEFRDLKGNVTAIAVHDNLVAAATVDGQLAVFDVRKSIVVALNPHAIVTGIASLQWSPEGNHLAVGGMVGDVSLWHVASLNRGPSKTLAPHRGPVRSMAWSPHSHGVLATSGLGDGFIHIHNVHSGEVIGRHNTGCAVYNVVWSKTCQEMVSSHGLLLPPTMTPGGAADSSDPEDLIINSTLSTMSSSSSLANGSPKPNCCVVWEVRQSALDFATYYLNEIQTLNQHQGPVNYVAMSPDGQNVATVADETLRMWMTLFPPKIKPRSLPIWSTEGAIQLR